MAKSLSAGDCVRIPDGRIGRVREQAEGRYRVRVRRKTGNTHQFLEFEASELHKLDCPKGWMSPAGYVRYLKITLAKIRERLAKKRPPRENK